VIDSYILSSVDLLVSTLNTDFGSTISKITQLFAHGEITFDLLYVILIPCTLFTLLRPVRCIVELMTVTRESENRYKLHCESIDQVNHTAGMGRVKSLWLLSKFEGTMKIQDLTIFPLKYHCDENGLREALTKRGNKWAALNTGVHHKQYNGVAVLARAGLSNLNHNVRSRILSVVPARSTDIPFEKVKGRIMVDGGMFINSYMNIISSSPDAPHSHLPPSQSRSLVPHPTPGTDYCVKVTYSPGIASHFNCRIRI
jgi:hypothetical protein